MTAVGLNDPITEWPVSHALWQRSQHSLAGGVSTGLRASMRPHPIFFENGLGSQLWDVDGNRYTDYVLGWGPVLLGHSQPEVIAAVAEQLPKGQTFGSSHRLEYEVAEKLLALLPGMQRVLWSNTGTEADQSALRLARAFTGRQRLVKFAGHYHGWQDSVLVSYRGAGTADSEFPVPETAGQSRAAMSDTSIARWNDIESLRVILEDPANDIAAVVAEPVLCNTGVIAPADGFLEQLRALCTRTGTLLIFDEVITGFRLAPGGATALYGVVPDLMVLAKGIANGFTLSAVAGRADVIDQVMAGVVHAGTYNGNPIVLAAAGATLDRLVADPPHERMTALAAMLASGALAAFTSRGIVATAHHVGPVVQLAFSIDSLSSVEDYFSADWDRYQRFAGAMMARRVFCMPGGRWYLSAAHTRDDVLDTVARIGDALDDLIGSGAL